MQAQDVAAATLGIWARSDVLTATAVARAQHVERSVVRVWCLRGTLHLVGAEDVRWLLDLLRPVFATANRVRRLQLGLDDDATARGTSALVAMLSQGGALTRPQIAERLTAMGIASEGQATIHVIGRAALDGLVCFGPEQNGSETFVLLDDWVPREPRKREREAALTELARCFLRAYGPATPEDLSTWSGLALREARQAWRGLDADVVEIETAMGRMWALAGSLERVAGAAGPLVRLLPAYDGLWLGYRNRDVLLPAAHEKRVYPGGGLIRPCVLVDGVPVGTWTRRHRGKATEVLVEPFEPLGASVRAGLEATVGDLGRFLGRPTRLV